MLLMEKGASLGVKDVHGRRPPFFADPIFRRAFIERRRAKVEEVPSKKRKLIGVREEQPLWPPVGITFSTGRCLESMGFSMDFHGILNGFHVFYFFSPMDLRCFRRVGRPRKRFRGELAFRCTGPVVLKDGFRVASWGAGEEWSFLDEVVPDDLVEKLGPN